MKTILRTLLASLALAMAMPALAAPVVFYEVSIPTSAIEASLGAGLFDGKGSVDKANALVLHVEAELAPVQPGPPLNGLFQADDGFALFRFDLPRLDSLKVSASVRGVGATSAAASVDVGRLSDNLSTDTNSLLVVEDIFDSVRPGNRPSLFRVNRFEFELSILGELEQFEITLLQATDELLNTVPELGGSKLFQLLRKNESTFFRTSDFDMRLTDFDPDGAPVQGGGNVPEPTSLALVAAALAVMARARRGVVG
jgi:PEP-CTERM motif